MYQCTINLCLPSHRNQIGQGENIWKPHQLKIPVLFIQCSLCLLGLLLPEDGQKVMIQLKRFFTAARVNPLWSPPLLPVADSVFIDILAGTWAWFLWWNQNLSRTSWTDKTFDPSGFWCKTRWFRSIQNDCATSADLNAISLVQWNSIGSKSLGAAFMDYSPLLYRDYDKPEHHWNHC